MVFFVASHAHRGGESVIDIGVKLEGPPLQSQRRKIATRSVRRRKELVGGLEQFLFFHILGIIIPTD